MTIEATEQQVMTEREASQLTEKIRITAHNYADARQKLAQYVAQAKAGNAHLALGYASWTAYLSEVLGEEPMRLARGERQEMVQMLSAEGMSSRAIAPIVGTTDRTVRHDLAGGKNFPPDSAEVLSTSTDPHGDEHRADTTVALKATVGMDGKTYQRPVVRNDPKPDDEQHNEKDAMATMTKETRPMDGSGRPVRQGVTRKDIQILQNIALGLSGYGIALEPLDKTGLDKSVTAEEASALHADLSQAIKIINRTIIQLRNRKDS